MRMSDLSPFGQKVEIGTQHFSAEGIIHFASRFDPQVFHMDAEAARQTLFGGLCASGWHTCAVWMRTFVDYWTAETARLISEGQDPPRLGPSPGFRNLAWLRPVFAGDDITFYVTLLESRDLSSRKGRTLNTILCEGVNAKAEPVIRFESTVIEFI